MDRRCKVCNILKPIYEFNKTSSYSGKYRRRVCKSCQSLTWKKPKKEPDTTDPEVLKKRKKWLDRYYKQKERKKYTWSNELYSYIISLNIFTESELQIIHKFLRKIDELGNKK